MNKTTIGLKPKNRDKLKLLRGQNGCITYDDVFVFLLNNLKGGLKNGNNGNK